MLVENLYQRFPSILEKMEMVRHFSYVWHTINFNRTFILLLIQRDIGALVLTERKIQSTGVSRC